MNSATSRFVERFGLLFEREGVSRIAGRITALLLVSEGAMSLDELAATLSVSKASVSTEARRLENRGLLVRSRRQGDRRDYYEFAPGGFRPILQARLEAMERMGTLIAEARRLPGLTTLTRGRVEEWIEVNDAMIDAMTSLLSRWGQGASDASPTSSSR